MYETKFLGQKDSIASNHFKLEIDEVPYDSIKE